MRRGQVVLASVLFTCVGWGTALAQTTETTEGLALADALRSLSTVSGSLGEALVISTQLEVGTAPLPGPSGVFNFVVDPATGVDVRTPSTFGPTFAERVLTAGKDRKTIGISFISASYDMLGDVSLDTMNAGTIKTQDPNTSLTGTTSLVMSTQSLIISGSMGLTDDLDIRVAVPLVKVDIDGISFVENGRVDDAGDPDLVRLVNVVGRASGVGDVSLSAKYRFPFIRFGDEDAVHDGGGVGALFRVRMPTGDTANLRGLGITRVLASLIVSGGTGAFGYHGNAGYEWWSADVPFQAVAGGAQGTLRGMVEFAAGVELAAGDLTVFVDVLGRHVGGGGSVVEATELDTVTGSSISFLGLSASDSLRKMAVAPGLKFSLSGSLLLSLNALIPISDNGLHDQFTPVVGLDWVF